MTDLVERLRARLIQPRPDCQLYPDPQHKGYGIVWVDGKSIRAHRLIWEAERGPIPEGLVIDHLCRVRACCNVDHMELVTAAENSRRRKPSASSPLRQTRRTALVVGGKCSRMHDITAADIYVSPGGNKQCRKCRRERERARERRPTP